MLCELSGARIADLTPLSWDRQGSFRLNAPGSLTFKVRSDHNDVAGLHTDAVRMLATQRRVVKAYRDGVLRFAGRVWTTQDEGGATEATTAVTCFDPLEMLAHRFCRDVTTGLVSLVGFSNAQAGLIFRDMIDKTHTETDDTGIRTTGGTIATTSTVSVRWEYKLIADAMRELMSMSGGFDLNMAPIDQTDGKLVQLNIHAKRGISRPNAVFAWDTGPKNVSGMRRFVDGGQLANAIFGVANSQAGADQIRSFQGDNPSITAHRWFEDVSNYSDITTQAFLDALLTEEVAYRRNPQITVEMLSPIPGLAPAPWDDYDLGDTVTVAAGAKMRGGFSDVQRIYGFDVEMGDVERVTRLVTSPEGA